LVIARVVEEEGMDEARGEAEEDGESDDEEEQFFVP
jgi:hypothetical protein